VQDCVVTSFGPTETSAHGNIWLVLAHPRNWSRSSAGPHHHVLWANRDIFAWHHTTCLGPPKELMWRTSSSIPSGQLWRFHKVNMGILMVPARNRLKLRAKFISPLLIDFQSPSHSSSTTPFTGSWSVSVQVQLHLLVYDRYLCKFTEEASLPYIQYNSVLLVYDWYYMQVCWRGLAPLLPITDL
jgi:hypothetical protein